MRTILLSVLMLSVAACAEHRPPFRGGHPPLGTRGPGGMEGEGDGRVLFISPMGEPFRMPHPEDAWFAGADVDHDGRVLPAELRADAARFFKVLDRAGDGEIDPDDIDYYENQLAPEIRVRDSAGRRQPRGVGPDGERGERGGPGGGMGGGGGGPGGGGRSGGRGGSRSESGPSGQSGGSSDAQGAARYGYLGMPEPITPADRNFNRGIDAGEFLRAADERFAVLDRNHDGALTPADFPRIDTRVRGGFGGGPRGQRPGERMAPPPGGAPHEE